MKAPKYNWLKILAAVLTLGIAGEQGRLVAQEEEEEIFELSPFTVDESAEVGYQATQTLAGSRLNMQLRDVGSAVSVMTQEFMDDTGANDAGTLLSYGLNTEVASGDQGNFSDAVVDSGGRYNQRSARVNPQGGQRVRGLASATLTRDYFLTSIPFDRYNTTAVTINRGPNSLLFGIGSPGGVINNAIKQANIGSNFGEIEVRIGERESHRVSLDYNKTLIEDRVALRLSFLESNTKFQQVPAFEEASRQYVALNAILAKNENVDWLGNTTLRANFEEGTIEGAPVNNIPMYDHISSWFGMPDNVLEIAEITGVDPVPYALDYTPKWTVDNHDGFVTRPLLNTVIGPWTNGYWEHLPVVFNDPRSTESSVGLPDPTIDGVLARVQWARGDGDPGWGRSDLIQSYSYFHPVRTPGFLVPNIIDTNVYDNRRMLLTGTNQMVKHDFEATNFRLEQLFLDNKAGIELAYNKERYILEEHMPSSNAIRTALMVDLNERLTNNMVNPNVGRPFLFDIGTDDRNVNHTEREANQATAFYELDFEDFSGGWIKWLGRHVITAFVGSQSIDNTNFRYRNVMTDITDATDIASYQNNKLHAWRRNIPTVVYLGPSLLGPEFQSLSDVRIDTYWHGRTPRTGDIVTELYQTWNPTWRGDEFIEDLYFRGDFLVQEFLINGGRSRREIDSEIISTQSHWLDDHVVTVVGWRSDEMTDINRVRPAVYNQMVPNTDNYRFESGEMDPGSFILGETPEDSATQSGDTFTASIVAHVPKAWVKLPYDSQFSLHYNESENFSASGVRRTVYGAIIPAPTGETTDYGISLNTLGNMLTIRLNWFETSNSYAPGPSIASPGWVGNGMNRWRDAETGGMTFERAMALNAELTGTDVSHLFNSYQDVYDEALSMLPQPVRDRWEGWDEGGAGKFGVWTPNPGQAASQDFVAEGVELDIIGRLTENWSVALNVGEQETVTSNVAPVASEFVFEVSQNYANSPLGGMIDSPNLSVENTWTQRWNNSAVNPMIAALAKEGQVSLEQRRWRVNFVSNYSFSEGFLEGFQVGGAIRWQDEIATGYPIEVSEDGRVTPIISSPFFGEDEMNGDIWLKYGRPIGKGNINWLVQLNVRNIYRSNNGFIPMLTNPDGRDVIFRNPNPKEIFLTNTFKF